MINRAMQRFFYDRRNAMSLVALAVFMVHGIASIPLATADDGRNQLPKKQHKDSDAPFLKPAEAVSKMAIKGKKGFKLNKPKVLINKFDYYFGEDQGRYIIEIEPKNLSKVQNI